MNKIEAFLYSTCMHITANIDFSLYTNQRPLEILKEQNFMA